MKKLCHNTSVVASQVDVICYSVSAAVNMIPVHQYGIQLFLCTCRCPVGSLLFGRFSVHRAKVAAKFCIITHCFIHSPLLFPSLGVCGPTLTRSTPNPGPNSALKSPPTNRMLFFLDFVSFSIDLYVLSTWWSACPEWREVHTHQQYTLLVDCDRRCYGSFVDVVCPFVSFSPLLVRQYSNSMSVLEFSSTHEYGSLLCLPSLGFV